MVQLNSEPLAIVCFIGLLNISNIWPFRQHMGEGDPPEETEGGFKKHTLSLAEGRVHSCPEDARREGRSHLEGRSI
jgi:hypothetical protein